MLINNNYFNLDSQSLNNKVNSIKSRQNRATILNSNRLLYITRGDILAVVFRTKSLIYRFEGICMSIKNKSLLNPNTSFFLRNILFGVGIEFTFSYYYNRSYSLRVSDYKRKQFNYKSSKLYFLRDKLNRASRIL